MKRFLFVAVLILFLTFFYSCQMLQNVKSDQAVSEVKIENSANFKFEDLPVPSNLGIVNEESFVYETSNYRTGIIKYSGNDDFKNVSNFFKGELPKYNWVLVNSIEYKDKAQLIFEKPNWIVVLYIEQSGRNVKLTITIGPKATGTK